MRLTVILAALTLGACSTTTPMESALAPLSGQPIQLVFDQLGQPTAATPYGSDTVYEWTSGAIVPGASLRGTQIGGTFAAGENTVTSGVYGAAVPRSCSVRILADSQGRIKDWQVGEQTGGCRDSASTLRQLAYSEPR